MELPDFKQLARVTGKRTDDGGRTRVSCVYAEYGRRVGRDSLPKRQYCLCVHETAKAGMPEGGYPLAYCHEVCPYREEPKKNRRPIAIERRLLLLRDPSYRAGPTAEILGHLSAAGWQVSEQRADSNEAMWGVPRLVNECDPRPTVVMRWEESGVLFTNDEWRKACAWCYQNDIIPAQIDWGYFDHYHTFAVDAYQSDGNPSIRRAWGRLPETVNWGRADEQLVNYRDYMEKEWEIAGQLGPVPGTEPGYVLVYIQYSNHLSRLPAPTYQAWVNSAHEALAAAGQRVVWKRSKIQDVSLPPGSVSFIEGEGIAHLNTRLLRYAKHSVIITSTVSNEAVLRGLPVVACGRGWHSGLGVFAEPTQWHEIACTPRVDQVARAKWTNWWIRHSCGPENIAEQMEYALGYTLRGAAFMTGIGLGNLIMAVPAMKAFYEMTGVPLTIGPVRRMASGYPDLLTREPWVETATNHLPDLAECDIATSAAFPGERAILQNQADKIDVVLPGRSGGWPHEVYRNAEGARALSYGGPLPSCRLRIPASTRFELPTHYVVVGMDCTDGPSWTKRRWPHWERLVELWDRRTPLVFVGVKKPDWVIPFGLDLIGQTTPLEMASIIQQADAYVGVDNGPSHVAAAVRTPSVLIYGPTTSLQNGPWHSSVTVLAAPESCRPCIFWPEWTTCKDCHCMKNVLPERVVSALESVLERRGEPIRSETCAEQVVARMNTAQRYGIPPAQRWREMIVLWERLSEMRPKVVVEIGSLRGGWLYTIAPTCVEHAHLIGIDSSPNNSRACAEKELTGEGHHIEWIARDSHAPMTLIELQGLVKGEKVDVLHIDGDHSPAGVLQDWEMYSPLVRPGGLVLLHDAVNPTEEVSLALAELQRRKPGNVDTIETIADVAARLTLGIAIIRIR